MSKKNKNSNLRYSHIGEISLSKGADTKYVSTKSHLIQIHFEDKISDVI